MTPQQWQELNAKIDNMTIEEMERLMRAALDASECTRRFTVDEGFEALRQFVANGEFEAPLSEED